MSDPEETWEAIRDCPGFQVSWDGNFRSLDRDSPSGRRLKGRPVPTRLSNRGYPLVDLVNAEGKRVTRSAHGVMLETFTRKKCPEGMEARHYDDNPAHNMWRPGTEEESRARGGNLFWGTKQQNREDRARNSGPAPPKPRPQRECACCNSPFEGNGRRCHPCVEAIGKSAAERLSRGETLAAAMKALDYPSAEGLHLLAVRYGGYGARKSWWSRSVKSRIVTLRKRRPKGRRSQRVSRPAAPAARSCETPPEGRKSVAGFRTKPGQSGTFGSQIVAERDIPKVTERDRVYPYPSDLTQRDRPRRRPGGVTGRSR